MFGLTTQIRRCSDSIPANIAEGCGRLGNAELHGFPQIACGSASELEYRFPLAKDLGYVRQSAFDSIHEELLDLKRMLVALSRMVAAPR
jgi:four helix bundle protein